MLLAVSLWVSSRPTSQLRWWCGCRLACPGRRQLKLCLFAPCSGKIKCKLRCTRNSFALAHFSSNLPPMNVTITLCPAGGISFPSPTGVVLVLLNRSFTLYRCSTWIHFQVVGLDQRIVWYFIENLDRSERTRILVNCATAGELLNRHSIAK